MKQTYLPGTVRERIQDLMKGKKMTQADLAKRIGITESTLSRLSGQFQILCKPLNWCIIKISVWRFLLWQKEEETKVPKDRR